MRAWHFSCRACSLLMKLIRKWGSQEGRALHILRCRFTKSASFIRLYIVYIQMDLFFAVSVASGNWANRFAWMINVVLNNSQQILEPNRGNLESISLFPSCYLGTKIKRRAAGRQRKCPTIEFDALKIVSKLRLPIQFSCIFSNLATPCSFTARIFTRPGARSPLITAQL